MVPVESMPASFLHEYRTGRAQRRQLRGPTLDYHKTATDSISSSRALGARNAVGVITALLLPVVVWLIQRLLARFAGL
jgi:hypothetical protein